MFASFILFHYLRSFLLLERTCTLPKHVTAPAAPTPFHPLPPFLHFTIYCFFPSHRRLLNISTHIAFPLAAPPTHSSRKQNTTLKPDARARVPIAIIWAKQWITDDGKLLARLDAAAKAAEAKPSTQGAADVIAAAAQAHAQGSANASVACALAALEVRCSAARSDSIVSPPSCLRYSAYSAYSAYAYICQHHNHRAVTSSVSSADREDLLLVNPLPPSLPSSFHVSMCPFARDLLVSP